MTAPEVDINWLLDSDPALRWQVERDLVGAPASVWGDTKARVATEGFGAALLAKQDRDGQWAGGSFFADFDFHGPEAASGAGQPWTATTWTLNALRDWGLDAAVLAGTAEMLARNSRWDYDQGPYWHGEVDCCINSYTLANGAWLGADVASGLAEWFVEHQMAEGGWNCDWVEGSTRASFHSTLNALKGLLYYETAIGGSDHLRAARRGGEEYLLQRRLLHRLSSEELVGPWATVFAYPFRWHYTVLKAADYFLAAARYDNTVPDTRIGEAIDVIRAARRPDGSWLQEARYPGRVWFEVDVPPGEPSKWLTFYGTRVLRRWDDMSSPTP